MVQLNWKIKFCNLHCILFNNIIFIEFLIMLLYLLMVLVNDNESDRLT